MSQIRLTEDLLNHLLREGVEDFVLCAGARNAPLVSVLSQSGRKNIFSFYEERSAAFFALGICQRKRRPVAVITTSGTAAAELYPAMIEAHYQELPLLAVTADRPSSYRDSGAPQTINQHNLFGKYALCSWDFDLSLTKNKFDWPKLEWSGPQHLNLCFDEPLIDDSPLALASVGEVARPAPQEMKSHDVAQLRLFFKEARRPLIVVSELTSEQAAQLRDLPQLHEMPIYIESHSQLLGENFPLRLQGGDAFITRLFRDKIFDSVIRIGGIPTLRLWRDLESKLIGTPVLNISSRRFPGLARPSLMVSWEGVMAHPGSLNECLEELEYPPVLANSIQTEGARLSEGLEKFPLSEPAWMQKISEVVRGSVFLGNSLIIREWDLVAAGQKGVRVFANRGTNGIDGLVSTGLGALNSDEFSQRWIVIGDLSALYDLNSLWAVYREFAKPTQIVVVNNSGGKIFNRIFKNSWFENEHGLNFSAWADLFKINYCTRLENLNLAQSNLIELQPDSEQTKLFWQTYEPEK